MGETRQKVRVMTEKKQRGTRTKSQDSSSLNQGEAIKGNLTSLLEFNIQRFSSETSTTHFLTAQDSQLTSRGISIFILILFCNCYGKAGEDDSTFIKSTLWGVMEVNLLCDLPLFWNITSILLSWGSNWLIIPASIPISFIVSQNIFLKR